MMPAGPDVLRHNNILDYSAVSWLQTNVCKLHQGQGAINCFVAITTVLPLATTALLSRYKQHCTAFSLIQPEDVMMNDYFQR